MRWNWQLSDWTKFTFNEAGLRDAEARFLKGAGMVVGSMHHLDGAARQRIVVEVISQEMVDSSAIEGEILDRDSVQSSIARQLGFAAKSTPESEESGVSRLVLFPLAMPISGIGLPTESNCLPQRSLVTNRAKSDKAQSRFSHAVR